MHQFMIRRNVLLETTAKVIGAVDKKQVYPILSHCLVRIQDGMLSVVGSDLEIQVQVSRELEREVFFENKNLEFTLPAKKIYDFCRALNDNHLLELTVDVQRVSIKSPESTLDITTFDAQGFPSIETKQQPQSRVVLSQKNLKQALESVSYAMAVADIRYYLNGVFLQLEDDKLTIVATDGHRLACTAVEYQEAQKAEGKTTAIMPRRAVLELLRLLEQGDHPIELKFNNQTITLVMDDLTFFCKAIEGKYPDYRRVLPRDLPYKLEIDRDEIKQALLLIQPILSSKDKGVLLWLQETQIEIKAHNNENDQIKVVVRAKGQSPETKIGFNVNYLNDFINSSKSKKVVLSFKDESVGVVFHQEGQGFYLVMPLRL